MKPPFFPAALMLIASPFALAADTLPNLPDPGARVEETKPVTTVDPASPPAPSQLADLAEAQKARDALNELVRAYELGNIAYVQSKLDPSMIGYQRFIDGLMRDVNLMKQIRINLFDMQVTAGPDVAIIQSGWEKRYLPVTAMTIPQLLSGRSMFLLHKDKEKDEWRIAAFAGDNLFSSLSGVLGQLSVSPMAFSRTASCSASTCPTLTISLVDPDLAGVPSVTVDVSTTQGDRETVTLTTTTPGYFTGSIPSFLVDLPFVPVPGSGNVELAFPLPPQINISVRYLDQIPGSNSPPRYLTRVVRFTAP